MFPGDAGVSPAPCPRPWAVRAKPSGQAIKWLCAPWGGGRWELPDPSFRGAVGTVRCGTHTLGSLPKAEFLLAFTRLAL